MITNQEIIKDKIKFYLESEFEDFFGVKTQELLKFIKFEFAKEFLKDEYLATNPNGEEWNKNCLEVTRENVFKEIIDYLQFAWGKANDCRGLSANRSIEHFRALLWLLDDGSLEKMESIKYEHYGKEMLIFVSELVGFDWIKEDDGIRTN